MYNYEYCINKELDGLQLGLVVELGILSDSWLHLSIDVCHLNTPLGRCAYMIHFKSVSEFKRSENTNRNHEAPSLMNT